MRTDKNKNKMIMTAIQLRAELFREINPLLDNETAMQKMLTFVKHLVSINNETQQKTNKARQGWEAAAKQAHADGQDKLMADDIFAEENMEEWKW